jgi:hypothetical protein
MVLAVNVVAVARPLELVVALVLFVPLAKLPDAPLEGAVKVIVTPATGLPEESVALATSALEKALPTVADCAEPETAVTVAAEAAVLVRLN